MGDSKAIVITEQLPCKLDHFRTEQLNNQLRAGKMEEMRLRIHLKQVTDSLKDLIKEQEKLQRIAAVDLTNGYEMKPIACEQKIEGDDMVTYRRDDNSELRRRPLTVEERRERNRKTHEVRP